MDAKYFMVGDWVLDDEGTPFRVAQVNDSCFGEHSSDLMLEDGDIYTDVKPIPLTAEILEKNGFVYNDIPFVQGWEQFGLLLYAGGNGYRINCGTDIALIINSVHELQHALMLCGIDKEITLR